MRHRVSKVPIDEVAPRIRQLMGAVDGAIGGSEWMQVFAHSPELYADFSQFYYDHIMTEREGISVRLTELVRHRVALHNECHL